MIDIDIDYAPRYGVKVTSDKKEQTKVAKEQIDKNIKVMR